MDVPGNVLAAGYEDSIVRLFNPRMGKAETEKKGHEDSILDVRFDIRGKSLISTSSDKTFRLWQ